jgi:hypothetical protein
MQNSYVSVKINFSESNLIDSNLWSQYVLHCLSFYCIGAEVVERHQECQTSV